MSNVEQIPVLLLRVLLPILLLVGICRIIIEILKPDRKSRRRGRRPRAFRRRWGRSAVDEINVTAFADLDAVIDSDRPVWSEEFLRKLEWKGLEILTTDFFTMLGFRAENSRVGPDGGVDVTLYRQGETKPVGVAQCKAWHSRNVGIGPIRELLGVMAAEHVQNGIFVTTSTFTDEARSFAQGQNIELVDCQRLLQFIEQLSPDRRTALLERTFADDYATPTCPNCGIKMVLRTASHGKDQGSQFWGCPNYPSGCRRRFNIPA